jgi:flagellar motor switch/type III secretory pathway protein FliN
VQQISDWLPESAFTEETVGPALHDAISSWCGRWFSSARAEVSAVRLSQASKRMAQGLHVASRSCEAELSGRGKRALLEAALGIDLSGLSLAEGDHRILDSFATAAVNDLLTALDALGEHRGGGPVLCATLVLAGTEMGVLALPSQLLVSAIKKAIGPIRKPAQAPRSRAEALKLVTVKTEGYLGRAQLTVDDLQGLAVGDVIVLDNSLKDPVELRMPDSQKCIGRGKLVRTAESVSIQF